VAAGALLVVAACGSVLVGLVAGVPLFDGLAPPPPYRWVRPPPELRRTNRPPAPASATVALTDAGSAAAAVSTADDQVRVSLPAGAVPPSARQTALGVAIQPLDPAQVPLPPAGTAIQGNAYRISVAYLPSGNTATAVQPVDVTLRYPVDATQMILFSGSTWQALPTTLESAALAVDATTTQFGVFAAASTGVTPATPRRTSPWAYVAAGVALVAAGIPTLASRRRTASRGPARKGLKPRGG
jgi:hypothetical protein